MGVRFVLVLPVMLFAAGILLESGTSQSSASARPAVSARITAVDAMVGSTAVHVAMKAKCDAGWSTNTYAQRLMVREDLASGPIIAFTNFVGSDQGWVCDGQDHTLDFNLVADDSWNAGSLRADFYATVADGTNTAVDFARKSVRIR